MGSNILSLISFVSGQTVGGSYGAAAARAEHCSRGDRRWKGSLSGVRACVRAGVCVFRIFRYQIQSQVSNLDNQEFDWTHKHTHHHIHKYHILITHTYVYIYICTQIYMRTRMTCIHTHPHTHMPRQDFELRIWCPQRVLIRHRQLKCDQSG